MNGFLVTIAGTRYDIPVSFHKRYDDAIAKARGIRRNRKTPRWLPAEASSLIHTAVVTFRDGLAVDYEIVKHFDR